MKYLSDAEYEYVMNKYHDANADFDPFRRFIRRDELFAKDSGAEPEDILRGIWENDSLYSAESHPIRKARALEYILMNTRIHCDERDIFPAVNMLDRPIHKTLVSHWQKEVFSELIPDVKRQMDRLNADGVATIWPDYDHSVPVWERLFELGICGILQESEQARRSAELTEEQTAFYEGIKITYEAVLRFIGRLYDRATSPKMKDALDSLRRGAPKSFYEALLLSYLYFIISEHIDSLQVRSLSNFDRVFLRFYRSDLQKGVSEDEIRHDLACYMLQFTAIGNYWNQPVYLGGENADGSSVINELSYLFLDVYDGMGIYNPKIQIKVSESTPRSFLAKAMDMIRRGHNCIVFVCDSTIRRALVRAGADEEQATLCNVTGCYEYSVQGSFSTGMNYLNLLKPLEYALHCGRDGVSGRKCGLDCPPPSKYADFESLYSEYKRQLLQVINTTVETVNAFEGYLHQINPLSLLSATFPSCIQKGRDAIGGGACSNNTGMAFGFIADLADSLAMIKKYVFDKKLISPDELVRILDTNFEGQENLRMRLQIDRDKYGNNKPLPDGIAADITDFIYDNLFDRPNTKLRGGRWNCGFHVARQSYSQGKLTAASANGRRQGEELSKNASASMGQNREGATAAILSVTRIKAFRSPGDVALDLGLLPSAVKGEDGLEAMLGLLYTFMRRGGHAMHINVFDADTLRRAQAEPQKYADLQIRVCGWNVLWNSISREEQEGFIRQAEALI